MLDGSANLLTTRRHRAAILLQPHNAMTATILAGRAHRGIEAPMRTLKRPACVWLAAAISFALIAAAALVWSL